MNAVRIHARGGLERLVYEDAAKPFPRQGKALVRVRAAAVTPTELAWSSAYTTRDGSNRLPAVPGHEFAGIVELVAPAATEINPGAAVYALADFWRDGADAEYVAITASALARKPETLDFVAVPLSALTAWQALFDHGKLAPGQKVLSMAPRVAWAAAPSNLPTGGARA